MIVSRFGVMFADRDRVHSILHDAGWSDIDIAPLDVACTLPERELEAYITRRASLSVERRPGRLAGAALV